MILGEQFSRQNNCYTYRIAELDLKYTKEVCPQFLSSVPLLGESGWNYTVIKSKSFSEGCKVILIFKMKYTTICTYNLIFSSTGIKWYFGWLPVEQMKKRIHFKDPTVIFFFPQQQKIKWNRPLSCNVHWSGELSENWALVKSSGLTCFTGIDSLWECWTNVQIKTFPEI